MLDLQVRCNRAILETCTNTDCIHHEGHPFDYNCNPRHCPLAGTPSRCIEEVDLCKLEGTALGVDDGRTVIFEQEEE